MVRCHPEEGRAHRIPVYDGVSPTRQEAVYLERTEAPQTKIAHFSRCSKVSFRCFARYGMNGVPPVPTACGFLSSVWDCRKI